MSKPFSELTPRQRDAAAKKLDRAFSLDETRPLSDPSKALWAAARRGRGRPPKPAGEKVERVLISIDPKLLAAAEAFAAANGLDRSKLFALGVQAFMAADPIYRQMPAR